jgi:hypothetical protein
LRPARSFFDGFAAPEDEDPDLARDVGFPFAADFFLRVCFGDFP